MNYVVLNNGVKMPILGFGVFQIPKEDTERIVRDAIDVGFRLFDTAQGYGNERGLGEAIRKSGIDRSEFFITTKIWISEAGYEKAKSSILQSLQRLNMDYVDLLLIHQPFGDYYGTYRAMEELYEQGKLKAIGVSNFYSDRLIDLIKFNKIVPMVNQVETHPFHQQVKAMEVMQKYGVQIQAWAPFAEGKNDLFNNEILVRIGERHQKTSAQITLRYLIQRGISVLPKTVNKERMRQNFDIFDFELTEAEMAEILTLDQPQSQFFSHQDPETVERLTSLVRKFDE